ncbi:MAG: QueT transporter family protein, partial [Oscillospiraceae bacterium]|nr:QueT transporter family protein [Oscillospiraceae bacterium]
MIPRKITSNNIALCSMIAAVYTVLCLTTPWTSYGALQVRIAEALTLLPVLSPVAIGGVTLGCVISNLAGALTGMNPIGYIDAVVGSAATLIAAIISYKLRDVRYRGLPLMSALAPVAINAVVVGAELSVLFEGTHFFLT